MTADKLKVTIEHQRGGPFDRRIADEAVSELAVRPRAVVLAILTAAGIEGIRPRDSRAAMLRRLHARLTARVRARERAEC